MRRCTLASRQTAQSGFTFVELMIVVTIVGLLAALAIPNYEKVRTTSRLNLIYRNLREIDRAKDQWALEHNKVDGQPIADLNELKDYFRSGTVRDVVHEAYVVNPVGTPPGASLPTGVGLGPYGPGAFIPAP